MPVEIKELIVRAEVVAHAGAAGDNARANARPAKLSPRERDAIIRASVEQVLAHLEKRRER